jgi:methylenetetrahydrofolate reductase (NADPH)
LKVIEVINKGKTTISFEFFPPKTVEQEARLFAALDELKAYHPDFASITCGAMGTNRDKTLDWAKVIKQHGVDPVVHLTCIAETKEIILNQLKEMKNLGIENILALRGDAPVDQGLGTGEFSYASDLVTFIKKQAPEFCLGVAGYPEKHPQCASLEDDINHLKTKVDAGADYIITQLFFDNKYYFNFVDHCRQVGIKVPVIPGIMLITSLKQLKKMTEVCGAIIPTELLARLEAADGDNQLVQQIGIEHAVQQCRELIKSKVPGLHFFVMNQAGPVKRVLQSLKV